ncbi:alpha-ketoglutarate-dependent dioxygenase AlkB [Massilia sp. TS11]|uniref:alpha-ketoglutarate-dependent dioxygenase AlkB family protein n=1 Tax=Massilia sp. TS11 TaxID=2908003 RepID=UPI001EDA7D82|nr:alpha-ketoglutarate-dependent dioxygenase AlkB [Massilia sp. TS11]MCG2585291.1 alpha-ketoglutarate-dependent dioxygenase AlkB [Massilia sp. TS11]
MDLFASGPERLPVQDGELILWRAFALPLPSAELFARLQAETPWRAESILVFGRRHLQPRLTAWYGDAGYTYSGLALAPQPWTPLLQAVRASVEAATGLAFNSVLLNYYRDQRDSMGMHSDDEPELGPMPQIASLSLGATRSFVLRHKRSGQTLRLPLADGDLLLMAGPLQQHWQHGIHKATRALGPRLNLTFRLIR